MGFLEAVRGYGDVFESCCDFLGKLRSDKDLTKDQVSKAIELFNELNQAYDLFADELYDRIKEIENGDKQNKIYFDLKAALPSIVFETDLSDTDYMLECKDVWSEKPNGYYVSELVEAMYYSLLWFDKEDKYLLNRFINTHKEGYQEPAPTMAEEDSDSDSEAKNLINPKTPLTQVATAHMFLILRRRGVIKQGINDSELSKIVSHLTGFSAEKIRQTPKAIQEKTKDQLRDFLGEISEELK